jgi:hypothetical protein
VAATTSYNVIITFDDDSVTTSPANVTTSATGGFSANFTIHPSTSGPHTVEVTDEGSNSASKTFTVTSSFAATSRNNVSSTENPGLTPTSQSSSNLSEKMIIPDMFG